MDQIVEYLQALNPFLLYPALSLLVFGVVKLLDKLGFLKDGNMQRVGVIAGTFLTSQIIDEAEQAIGGLLIGLVSIVFNEFSKWVGKKVGNE